MTSTHSFIHLGFWSTHAKFFLRSRTTGMVISAPARGGLGNLSWDCLYMCGRRRPPPRINVYNNSLQVMPLAIKVKRLARCRETDLSCWSYYSQIKLSSLGPPGRKPWNLNRSTFALPRTSTVSLCRCRESAAVCDFHLGDRSGWKPSDCNIVPRKKKIVLFI